MADEEFTIESLKGHRCYVTLDTGSPDPFQAFEGVLVGFEDSKGEGFFIFNCDGGILRVTPAKMIRMISIKAK